jgi:hypothetical protein
LRLVRCRIALGTRRSSTQPRFESNVGDGSTACEIRTKRFRAAEGLIGSSGELFNQLENAFQCALGRLTISWRCKLQADEWAAFLAEYAKGKSHIVYIVTMKAENWQLLPWHLCILGHFSEEVARRGARDCSARGQTGRPKDFVTCLRISGWLVGGCFPRAKTQLSSVSSDVFGRRRWPLEICDLSALRG